jgi:hypothetical protein
MAYEHKYKIGDLVRIKSWDQMVDEFGYDSENGSIDTTCGFLDHFKPLCGKTVKVNYVRTDKGLYYFDIAPANLSKEETMELDPKEFTDGIYQFSDDEIAGYADEVTEYKTNGDFYWSLDEFGRTVYITNFVRNYNGTVDVYSRLGQEKIKKDFKAHLGLPYISEELVDSLVNNI